MPGQARSKDPGHYTYLLHYIYSQVRLTGLAIIPLHIRPKIINKKFLLNKNCPGVGLFSNSLFQMNRTINFDVLYLLVMSDLPLCLLKYAVSFTLILYFFNKTLVIDNLTKVPLNQT